MMPPVFVLTLKAKRLSLEAAPRLVDIANKATSNALRFTLLVPVEIDSMKDIDMGVRL